MEALSALPTLSSLYSQISLGSILLIIILIAYFTLSFTELETARKIFAKLATACRFIWACFLKPHTGDGNGGQQAALESFYKQQAGIYDATRSRLLHGREDMLALCAAQLKFAAKQNQLSRKPIWVDIGGGTGFNIESMGNFLPVAHFFHAVYLVDLSPSLCDVAKARFARLGWENVRVVCQDARTFKLADYEAGVGEEKALFSIGASAYEEETGKVGADLLTLSYSLSMIPEFHPVVDSVSELLAPNGVIGVVDFYVQNKIEFQTRNYVGGVINRHCMWLSRVFWRTWFEADRVSLDSARRDYLEYKFGTVLSTNARNHLYGVRIPYYIWLGCAKQTKSSLSNLAALDAAVTESPFIAALDLQRSKIDGRTLCSSPEVRRSKAYDAAIVNLAASLPLPAAWYQQHHWRIYYDEQLEKHKQFGDEYIYAFTWEDARVDARLLNITHEDVVLAITSAGDNILSYALERPKRIHAVDLNPNQNHLLELKVAAFTALKYQDIWKIFGEGKHENFRQLLINDMSPHLSSHALDYWLHKAESTFSPKSKGLYYTGGSRHAIKLVSWLGTILGISKDLRALCQASTLNEQREIWSGRIRRVLLSQLLAYTVIGTESFLWKALGVPSAQRDMIERDYRHQTSDRPTPPTDNTTTTTTTTFTASSRLTSGQAIWSYAVQTLDPIAHDTLLTHDNHYYLLCLQAHYTPRCHPAYLSPRAHTKLSAPHAFDGLRIHTDELAEVLSRMAPATLTIAVLMDSMDWFDPRDDPRDDAADGSGVGPAITQVRAVHRALKPGGRVLLRSAGLWPWYVGVFESEGFVTKRVGCRAPGKCVDRVNMYASTWICTKVVTAEQRD